METVPSGDRVWHIERHGTNPVPTSDHHGKPSELFWVWFAANMAFVTVIYGSILSAAGLNLWQSAGVALLGTAGSYALVGIVSLAGLWRRMPTLAISSLSFGTRGNIGPAVVSWLSLVGWEMIGMVLATYTILALFNLAGFPSTVGWTLVSLGMATVLVVIEGILGHATLVWLQRVVTCVFGALTLLIGGFLVLGTDWEAVLATRPGPWDSGVLATLSLIVAGTGITWINIGADYTRYLPQRSSRGAIVWWTVLGSSVPVVPLILVGYLLTARVPALATATNPISVIGAALPSWMAIPYLMTAMVGLLAGGVVSMYSSGLSFLAMGIKLPRYQSVVIDGTIMIVGAAYVLLVAKDFLGTFESFLQIASVALTAWGAVFLVDMFGGVRRPVEQMNWMAIAAWGVGISVGLLFTSSPLLRGPLAVGIFASSSFGYLFSGVVSLVLYAVLQHVVLKAGSTPSG